MARFIFKLSLFFVVAFGLVGCQEKVSWYQKLTIKVQTPNGFKTSSSVVFVENFRTSGWWVPIEARGVGSRASGEANVVNLGNGKFLFALLDSETPLAWKVFKTEVGEDAQWPQWAHNITRLSGEKNVPSKLYPMLVTFSDVNNPASVKLVDPNDLDAAFGCPSSVAGQASEASASPQTDADPKRSADDKPCYTLKSITLEITDEPVTTGKVAEFGFFQKLKTQSTLSGLEKYDPTKSDEIYYLTNKAFVRGDNK